MVFSLRAKLICITLIILAIPLTSISVFVVSSLNKEIEAEKEDTLTSNLSVASLIYENQLEKLRGLAQSISLDNTAKVTLQLGVRTQLEDYLAQHAIKHNLTRLIITDANGVVFCRGTKHNSFGDDLSSNGMVQKALRGKTIASTELEPADDVRLDITEKKIEEIFPKRSNRILMAQVASPIIMKGNVIGVALLGFMLNGDHKLARSMRGTSTGSEVLITRKDEIIASSLPGLLVNRSLLSNTHDLYSASSDNSGKHLFVLKTAGTEYLSTSRILQNHAGDTVGAIVALSNTAAVHAAVESIRDLVLLIGAVGTFLAVFITVNYAKHIANPVRAIVNAMDALGKGDLSRTLTPTSKDEIGQLANGFNRMARNIETATEELQASKEQLSVQAQDLRHALEEVSEKKKETEEINERLNNEIANRIRMEEAISKARDELEIRVKERTAELATTNTELESEINERKTAEKNLKKTNSSLVEALAREKSISTQLEHTMEQLEAASLAAQASTKAKSDFLANISHEIRTPMNAIIGYTTMMLQEETKETPLSSRLDSLNAIAESSRHLLELINEILDLSKIEAGGVEVESIPCNIPDMLNSVVSTTRPQAETKGVSLAVINEPQTPETINTDPTRLKQAILNLVSNAVKFTESGSVTIKVSSGNDIDKPTIRFSISDTGIGIPEDSLEHIFAPFSQADSSTTRRFGGTGLGLAITKQIAILLGGTLTAESIEGKGSTFTLEILAIRTHDEPVSDRSKETKVHETGKTPMNKLKFNGKTLIVEDSPVNRTMITLMLKKMNVEVVTVDNGKLAVEYLADNQVDLVLMDWQMPVMDGLEATQRIRGTGNKTPIVMLTANAMQGDQETCLAAGANGYLTKPIEYQTLAHELGKYLVAMTPVS